MMNAAEDACKLLEQDPGNCDFEPYSMIQVTWYKASLYGIFESGIQVHFYIFNKHLNISLLTFCKTHYSLPCGTYWFPTNQGLLYLHGLTLNSNMD